MNGVKGEAETRPLTRLATLLGDDVLFVPCEWGTKKPLVACVEGPFEARKSEAYQALFAVQEVNLGEVSYGLCET